MQEYEIGILSPQSEIEERKKTNETQKESFAYPIDYSFETPQHQYNTFKAFTQQQKQKIGDNDQSIVFEGTEKQSDFSLKDLRNNEKVYTKNNTSLTKISLDQAKLEESKFKIEINGLYKQGNILKIFNGDNESFESNNSLVNSISNKNPRLLPLRQQNMRQQSMWINNSNVEESSNPKLRENTKRKLTNHEKLQLEQDQDTQIKSRLVSEPQNLWKKKWIKIIFFINKIKRIAIQSSIFFRPHQLNQLQIKLIGDQGSNLIYAANQKGAREISDRFQFSSFDKYFSYRNYRKIIKFVSNYLGWYFSCISNISHYYLTMLQMIFQFIPLFHFLSSLYICWEIITFLCTAFLFLYIPLEYSFVSERTYFIQYYFEVLCPIIYGIDIFIRSNTRSTENGEFIENHIKIFHNYLKTDMISDIISLISLNYRLWDSQATYFLFFIRITRSFRVISLLREQFLLKIKISGIISLLILLAQLLYFAHIVCCIWYGIGKHEQAYNIGWIIKYEIDHQPIQVQYLRSFYYSVITMTTIGYGDITPQTDIEKLIVILIAFISCCAFGYAINSIGNILSDFKLKNDLYLQEIAKINKYFKQYKVDLDLQARSRQYLDLIYSGKGEEMISSIDTLSTLSDYLQKEIKVNVFTKRLKQVKFFNELFSQETLEQIALVMGEKIYSPEQDIIDSDSIQEPMLYIVHSGTVKKYAQKSEKSQIKEIKTIYEGGIVGFDRFVSGNYESNFNYKSHGISSVIQVSLSQFLEVVKKNSDDYEKFIFVKDQLIFNQNQGGANLSCDSCWQKFHSLEKCPFIFYSGKKEQILRFYFRQINDQIKTFERKIPKICFNSRLSHQEIKKSVEFFQNNLSEFYNNDTLVNLEDQEDDLEQEDKISFNRLQLEKQNDKASIKEIPSNRFILDQDGNNNSQFLNKNEKQRKISQQKYSSPSHKISLKEEGYFITDGVLQNAQKSGLHNSQNESSKQQLSWTEIQAKIASELDIPDSFKNIPAIKTFKRNDNFINLRRLSSTNEQQSPSKKQDSMLEQIQQYKNQQSNISKEKRNSKILQSNKPMNPGQQDGLAYDQGLHFNRLSIENSLNKTLIINRSNLSQLVKSFPQIEAIVGQTNLELFIYKFDVLKIFQFYYPNQNYEQIIEKFNQMIKNNSKSQIFQKKNQKIQKKNN